MEEGCNVIVYDDCSRGSKDNVADLPVRLVVGDVSEEASISACVQDEKPSVVFHLAALHFLPECNEKPLECIKTNVVGTECLLRACADSTVRRVISPSSMAVYPISDECVKETNPTGPYDIYGETKVMNEMQMRRWANATGKSAIAVRLANVYGPQETNPHVIPWIMTQLQHGAKELELGDTSTYRDYIHSKDVARALKALVVAPTTEAFETFNLGTGCEHTVQDVLQTLSELLGFTIQVRTDSRQLRAIERKHLWPDISKLRQATGWVSEVEWRQGLAELCGHYGIETPCA